MNLEQALAETVTVAVRAAVKEALAELRPTGPHSQDREYLTPHEVAKVLKIHPESVRRRIRNGQLAATQIGRSWRVSASAVENLTKNTNQTTGDATVKDTVAQIIARRKVQ